MTAQQFKDIHLGHGKNLLRLFPGGPEQDPIDLCKKLSRFETKLHRLTTGYCNGDNTREDIQKAARPILKKITELLPGCIARVNWDPRGYALKFDTEDTQVHTDWGRNGIIAPQF